MVALIVVAVLVVVALVDRVADDPRDPAGARRGARAPRALPPHARAGPDVHHAVHRPRAAADRPARAGRQLLAAAGDHRGQRRRGDRDGALLHDHRRAGGDLRDREPAAGDRAADGDDAAQRDRRPHARADADEPRGRQHRVARACSTRRPASGGSASTASRSSRSTRRRTSRRRWRSRCAPSATAAPRS